MSGVDPGPETRRHTMNTLLDILPGVPVAVSALEEELAHIWDAPAERGSRPPSEFRASQMNLVLHFGVDTPAEEARAAFATALRFAQRYPCRIVALAPPRVEEAGGAILSAKLHAQCFIGSSHREMSCCEALALGFAEGEGGRLLESQVSVWLESDLPVYHWLHRVSPESAWANFPALVKLARRVILDSSLTGGTDDAADARIHDLAWARTLPLRQSMGQVLSAHDPRDLVAGLRCVTVRHHARYSGEAASLLAWQRRDLAACFACSGTEPHAIEFGLEPLAVDTAPALEILWRYTGRSFFHLTHQRCAAVAEVEGAFGHGRFTHPMHLRLLEPEQALAEALFF